MLEILIDLHLPFLFIALIIGFQISVYFFYLYFRERTHKVELNKILLGYGFLYGFLLISVLLRTLNAYFIEDAYLGNIFLVVSYGFLGSAAISFLYCVSSKGFNTIIQTKITKLIILLSIIFVSFIYIFDQHLIQIFLITVGVSIAGIYLFPFHFRLIKLSAGNIKKRIILFTLGSSLVLLGILLEADEIIDFFNEEMQIALQIFSVPIFILGELIIFLGLFQFSAFIEFDWKEHLLGLYIIDRKSLTLLYTHEFQDLTKKSQFKEIAEKLSKGIMGIDLIISAITKKQEELEKLVQDELIFLLKTRDIGNASISYIVLVNKEMDSFPYFLKKTIKKFEYDYKSILLHLDAIKGKEKKIFANFDNILNRMVS